jgi:hypothetical protein
MKRAIALLISAAVTAVILLVVLAVASPKTDPLTAGVNAASENPAVDPASLSNDPAVLQQQLQDAYTLLQQRDAAYQQRLQEAYTQLQAPRGEHEEEDEHEGREIEFRGRVEAMSDSIWTVGGQAVAITAGSQIKPGIGVGSFVKVQALMQEDGSLWGREIEREDD